MNAARDLEDAAMVSFPGASVGDAAGATLEFLGLPSPARAREGAPQLRGVAFSLSR
jgi:hypothetical protein